MHSVHDNGFELPEASGPTPMMPRQGAPLVPCPREDTAVDVYDESA